MSEVKKPVKCANDVHAEEGVNGVVRDLEGESENSGRGNMLGSRLPTVMLAQVMHLRLSKALTIKQIVA